MKITNVNSSELDQELIDALNEKEQECLKILNMTNEDNPKALVKKIREYVDKLLSENHSEENLREYALTLGSMWGKMVVKQYNWEWKYLDFGDEIEGIYIVSPKQYYVCSPLLLLTDILLGNNQGFDGQNDNTTMLLFNMLDGIENKVPKKNYMFLS